MHFSSLGSGCHPLFLGTALSYTPHSLSERLYWHIAYRDFKKAIVHNRTGTCPIGRSTPGLGDALIRAVGLIAEHANGD